MPTRRGQLLLGGALLVGITGRILGVVELYVVAIGLGVLVGLAWAAVRLAPLQIGVQRTVTPRAVRVGDEAVVKLRVQNRAHRPTPPLSCTDNVDNGRRLARFLLSPVPAESTVVATYRTAPTRRGLAPLGPLVVDVADPFGLAQRSVVVGAASTMPVSPPEELVALPETGPGTDPRALGLWRDLTGRRGEEFFALRPYVDGDDLRLVHWASVAKTDTLIVRQDEIPQQGWMTVVADLRRPIHSADSLEEVLAAAASLLASAAADGRFFRFVSTGRVDTGFGDGRPHLDLVRTELARASTTPPEGFAWLRAVLARTGASATVTLTTTRAPVGDLRMLAASAARAGTRVVRFPVAGAQPGSGTADDDRVGTMLADRETLTIPPGARFSAVWGANVAARPARAGDGAGR